MSVQIVFTLVLFLHNLFTVAWIGGLIALAVTVLPSVKQVLGMGPQTKKLMDAIQKRHSVLVYVSMVGLVLTGLLLGNRSASFQGLFSLNNAYSAALSAKHILVLAMIAISLYRSLALGRRQGPPTPAHEKLSAGLLLLNLGLGIVVLLLSGLTTALGAAPVV
ncbi:MAG: CopD family protein [Thermoflexales bacterium]|nr:CopD family protein [Thermoflexales bacterium]